MKQKLLFFFFIFMFISSFSFLFPNIEFTFSLTNVSSVFTTEYSNYHHPQFLYEKGTSTGAHQRITMQSLKKLGYSAGINIMLTNSSGIELSYTYQSLPLTGTSTDYDVFLIYTSIQPPDYTPTLVYYRTAYKQDNPTGNLIQKTFGLNFLKRFYISSKLFIDLSHGFSLFNIKGDYSSLAYSYYWLGGHSVIFSELLKLQIEIKPISKIGLNFREKLNFKLSNHSAFFLTIAGYYCPSVKAEQGVLKILSTNIMTPTNNYQQYLNLSTLNFNPSFLYIGIGVNLFF